MRFKSGVAEMGDPGFAEVAAMIDFHMEMTNYIQPAMLTSTELRTIADTLDAHDTPVEPNITTQEGVRVVPFLNKAHTVVLGYLVWIDDRPHAMFSACLHPVKETDVLTD